MFEKDKDIMSGKGENEIDWITVKGQHVPIKNGEDKKEAITNFFQKSEELYEQDDFDDFINDFKNNADFHKDFVKAKTISEAEQYAKNILGVKNCCYQGFDVEVANDINYALMEEQKIYPNATGLLWYIGSNNEYYKLRKNDAVESLMESFIDEYPHFSEKDRKDEALMHIKYFDKELLGLPLNQNDCADFIMFDKSKTYIRINDNLGKDREQFLMEVRWAEDKGWFPKGQNKISGVIHHEFGHMYSHIFGIHENKEMEQLFTRANKSWAQSISEYSKTSKHEFIAEGWAEFFSSKNPRGMARQVGRIVLNELNKHKV